MKAWIIHISTFRYTICWQIQHLKTDIQLQNTGAKRLMYSWLFFIFSTYCKCSVDCVTKIEPVNISCTAVV